MTEDDLNLAVRAAHSAGEVLMSYWARRSELTVSSKRLGDFVSEADLAAEDHLREVILGQRPVDGWLGEERGASNSSSRRWIVDPLDGTTNFLRGIPHWAISIALEVEGLMTLGVIYDPIKQETFAAQLGQGATLNGVFIQTSSVEDLGSAIFGTGIPFGGMDHIDKHASDIARLMPHCAGVRRMGSAALDLAYVACGRFDGFWERNLQLWDIAAGLVILREAGAIVEGINPNEVPETNGDVLAAAPGVFSDFSSQLRMS
jgi:myo-inositol-1(or 4)-monophosphatase